MLTTMVAEEAVAAASGGLGEKSGREKAHADILSEVSGKRLKVETLDEKLRAHVELCDISSALEMQTGAEQAARTVYLAPRREEMQLHQRFDHPLFAFQLLELFFELIEIGDLLVLF